MELNLPENMTEISKAAIRKVYGDIGSIKECKTVEDFGRYRFALVMAYEEQLNELVENPDIN